MRIPIWPGVKLSVWERQNPEALRVTMPNTTMREPVRRVLSKRGWAILLVRYDWRKSGRYYPVDTAPTRVITAPPEPPTKFTAAPQLPEEELDALRLRPHP